MSNYAGKRVEVARTKARAMLPCTCYQCGQLITADMEWVAEHTVPRALAAQMGMSEYEADQLIAVSHRSCSDRSGARVRAALKAQKVSKSFEKISRPGVFLESVRTPVTDPSHFSYREREEGSHGSN